MMKTPHLRHALPCLVAVVIAAGFAGHVFAGGYYGAPPVDVQSKIDALQQQMNALPQAYTDAKAAAASPVQSVNGAVGAVTVPAQQYQRVQDMAVPTNGTFTWTFPAAFNNIPSCYRDLASTATGYTFDDPLRVAVSKTSVIYKVTAHPTTVQIASLSLPITLPLTSSTVPAGTTLSLTCTAPQ